MPISCGSWVVDSIRHALSKIHQDRERTISRDLDEEHGRDSYSSLLTFTHDVIDADIDAIIAPSLCTFDRLLRPVRLIAD